MSQIVSTFNSSTDGWTIEGDVASFGWQETGGDPGGSLHWVDAASGADSYWVAASKFLGNKAGYYGGTLSYAVEDTGSNYGGVPDVEITGDGVTLVAALGQAGTDWTSYSIKLDETAGWTVGTLSGDAATAAQIQDVLGHLTSMLIRAEYVSGDESGGLDNVILATSGSSTAKFWLDGSDDWSTATDWSGGTVPVTASAVVIAQGAPEITGPINARSITITGAGSGLTVSAPLHYAGTFSAAAGTVVTVATSSLVLTGKVTLSGTTVNGTGRLYTEKTTTLARTTIGGTATLDNTAALTQSGGDLTLGDGGTGAASLINAAKGVYAIADDSGIGRGTSTRSAITNAGLIEKTGGSGTSTIVPTIANTGTISALSGTLDLAGAVSGKGAMQVGSNATLELGGAVAATQTVSFTGADDLLLLDAAATFKGTVAGLGSDDTIDLAGFAPGTAKLYYTPNSGNTGGTLKVISGTSRAAFTLDGQFVTANFHVAADTAGTGTAITYEPPALTVFAAKA